jgi:hypothetical protein
VQVLYDGMMRLVESRIDDWCVLRLIHQWLNAGVVEDRLWQLAEKGTRRRVEGALPARRAVMSPLRANTYLHYACDLWVEQWRRRHAHGAMNVVRYADDTVVAFAHRSDAERLLAELRVRMAGFARELHPDKTRLIEFGATPHPIGWIAPQATKWPGWRTAGCPSPGISFLAPQRLRVKHPRWEPYAEIPLARSCAGGAQ